MPRSMPLIKVVICRWTADAGPGSSPFQHAEDTGERCGLHAGIDDAALPQHNYDPAIGRGDPLPGVGMGRAEQQRASERGLQRKALQEYGGSPRCRLKVFEKNRLWCVVEGWRNPFFPAARGP